MVSPKRRSRVPAAGCRGGTGAAGTGAALAFGVPGRGLAGGLAAVWTGGLAEGFGLRPGEAGAERARPSSRSRSVAASVERRLVSARRLAVSAASDVLERRF